jgi:hypothetical protein
MATSGARIKCWRQKLLQYNNATATRQSTQPS